MQVRRITLLMLCLAIPVVAVAGPMEKTADLGLTFNQSAYSDSWTGSESGSMIWTFTGNLILEKAISSKATWKNDLKLSYGQTHLETKDAGGSRNWASPKKSTDRVFNESLLRFTLGGFVEPYVAVTFESQFHDIDDNLLTPALLAEAAGVGRELVKNEQTEFYTRIGLSIRQRMAYYQPTVNDGGVEWVTDFSRTFGEGDLKVVSKLRLFQAFTSSVSDDLVGRVDEDYWKSPDVAWETTFSAAVSKYIQTT
ncbi:MAG: DUF3078 domain-containing protein, partial [bacterium]